MIDSSALRQQSLQIAEQFGFQINPSLPLLEVTAIYRDVTVVVNRLLAMTALAATAYGFDRQFAAEWIQEESLFDNLVESEKQFLTTGKGDRKQLREQIEGMWALAWSIQIVDHIDFGRPCDDGFVTILPDLKRRESGKRLRELASLRPVTEIACACDLAYLLHWAIVDAQSKRQKLPGVITPFLVIERRRALEWLFCDEPWDDVAMDT